MFHSRVWFDPQPKYFTMMLMSVKWWWHGELDGFGSAGRCLPRMP